LAEQLERWQLCHFASTSSLQKPRTLYTFHVVDDLLDFPAKHSPADIDHVLAPADDVTLPTPSRAGAAGNSRDE
jgi:hypothetical protein